MVRQGEMKYTAWGTGAEHPPQLFNLTADPGEMHNLALQAPNHALAARLLPALPKYTTAPRAFDYKILTLPPESLVSQCLSGRLYERR